MAGFGGKTGPRIETLLKSIGKSWTLSDDGSLSSNDWTVTFLEAALIQLFPPQEGNLEALEVDGCAHRALRNVIRAKNLTADALYTAFITEIETTRSLPHREFHFVTRNHFRHTGNRDFSLEVLGEKITISHKKPAYDLSSFFVNGVGDVDLAKPDFGSYTVVPIWARTSEGAFERGSASIDKLYGALNYGLNLGNLSIRVQRQQPVAVAFPGAEIGIFNSDGSRFEDSVLYYSSVPERMQIITDKQLERVEKVTAKFQNVGDKVKYYEEFFQLYFRALAEATAEARVVFFWKLAERITFCEGQRDDAAAARLAIPWSDRDVTKAIAASFAHRRNWIIHQANPGIAKEGVFEIFRKIVDQFIWCSTSSKFDTIGKWRTFLELAHAGYNAEELEAAADALRTFDS